MHRIPALVLVMPLLLLAGASPVAQPTTTVAAPPSTPVAQPDPEAWVDRFIQLNVVPHLRVNAAHAEPVRTAAVAMVTEHLPRVKALMLRWLAEERAAPSPELAGDRTLARLYNEFGLWSLDSTGPAHDALLLQALSNEQACHPVAEPVTEMDQRLGRLRSLAPAELQRALAFERELLARWGTDRKLPAATPFPVAESIQRLRNGQATGHPPLPALLNAYVAENKGGQRREVGRARATDRCLLQHWSLRAALGTAADDTARAAALARWREGIAIRLPELLWMSRDAAGASPPGTEGYPELAKRFGLAGTVTLSVDLDGKGQLQRSSVLSRQLSVPGIPEGVRPVVFETLLDDATQARARSQTYKAPSDRQLVNGVLTASQAFIWKLE